MLLKYCQYFLNMLQKGCFTPKLQLSFLPFTSLVLTGSRISLGASCLFRHWCSCPDSHQLSIWALPLTKIFFSQRKHSTRSLWMYLLVFFFFLFLFPFLFFCNASAYVIMHLFYSLGSVFLHLITATTHNYRIFVYLWN